MCRFEGREFDRVNIKIMFKPNMATNSSSHQTFGTRSDMIFYMFEKWAFGFAYIEASTYAFGQIHHSNCFAGDSMWDSMSMAIEKRSYTAI